ncbi:molybdopterin molybdotransferase MoeA [Pelagicoccus sp. SDUM812003]|uniref:molybdopterin molybdotransferase MoeA n=1 Tax=Pelagicoccus sp. SDUM812003 TaxID=3041267 RepID=UPI0028108611|nr:molybdopterin molybdotransferase MoeA [Pelagicoccus sp. SDUM812003]MDQ8202311.1 molybdopterin molybdotransferase MoeA [Pelagicoccus sp. SDUM812003]
MITVQEAEKLILDNIGRIGAETVPITEAAGRSLQEPLTADRPLPPFNRAALDGIAISSSAYNMGARVYPVEGVAAAGAPPLELKDFKACIEVMTGAVMPTGTDCVIPVEEYEMTKKGAKLPDGMIVEFGQGIHEMGTDCDEGAELLAPGIALTAKEIAIAASIGKYELRVSKSPRIAIISTGNELVSIVQTPEPYQIRRSNDLTLATALAAAGYGDTELIHIPDDPEQISKSIKDAMSRCDALVLAGGVSKGKYDYIPETLVKLGVAIRFQWVSQRPGKPMWFGQFSRERERLPVFALPGNPVSCFTCLRRYVIPALDKWTDRPAPRPFYVKLDHDLTFKQELTLFLPVVLDPRPSGELWAKPALFNTSGDFSSVAKTSGFIELPRKRSVFPQGEAFPYYEWPS